jgi:hypothetical protein
MLKTNGLVLCAVGLFLAGPAFAAPDFTGVWRLDGDATALRSISGKTPPLTSWGREQYEHNQAAFARKDYSGDLTRLQCASAGAVRLITLPYPVEFFQRPFQLTMLFGWNHEYRLINLRPTAMTTPYELAIGISNGHWEGDTLVVRTTDLTDNTLLDSAGLPHGDKTIVTERIRMLDRRHMEDVVTITDPKAYSRDWSFRLGYHKTAAKGVAEDVCLDRMAAGGPALENPQ